MDGCLTVYVHQTGRSIEARCKEHMRHICIKQPEKSVVVEQSINTGHHIDCSSTFMLDRAARYMDHLVNEAIGI
jgi:hypothetical protein